MPSSSSGGRGRSRSLSKMREERWDIRREGRSWGREALARYALAPEKIEMIGGKLLASDDERSLFWLTRVTPDDRAPRASHRRGRENRHGDRQACANRGHARTSLLILQSV